MSVGLETDSTTGQLLRFLLAVPTLKTRELRALEAMHRGAVLRWPWEKAARTRTINKLRKQGVSDAYIFNGRG